MRTVDSDAFFAVSVVTAGFLAGTVILFGIFRAEFRGKFLLKPQSFGAVSLVEFLHRLNLFGMIFDNRETFSFLFYVNAEFVYGLCISEGIITLSERIQKRKRRNYVEKEYRIRRIETE